MSVCEIAMDDRKSAHQQNGGDTAQYLHVRCRVEWIPSAGTTATQQSPGSEAQLVADTLAALPRSCPFVDIVPATLYYLGYNTADIIGAIGINH